MNKLTEQLRRVPVWVWVIVGIVAVSGIGSAIQGEKKDEPRAETPASKKSEPVAQPIDLSVDDAADLIDQDRFCRAYANALSAGLGDDFAYGNFLRGYEDANVPNAPPAREVFDELVSRC